MMGAGRILWLILAAALLLAAPALAQPPATADPAAPAPAASAAIEPTPPAAAVTPAATAPMAGQSQAEPASTPYPAVRGRAYYPLLVLLVFTLMLILPFMPGLIEVFSPRDEYPLPVKMSYSKDPRYLGRSARRIFVKALGEKLNEEGLQKIRMSKEEIVEVSRTKQIPAGEQVQHAMYVPGELRSKDNVRFDKDVYVTGDAVIGENNRLRAVACDGNLSVGAGTKVTRWLDAERHITIGERCVLGVSCACSAQIELGDKVVFRRLFGSSIVTPGFHNSEPRPETRRPQRERIKIEQIRTIRDVATTLEGDIAIASAADVDHDLIVKGDLAFGDGVMMRGSARSYGLIKVGKGCIVLGDLFAEGTITIEAGGVVLGNVFSQDEVTVQAGARLGTPGAVKSVIGKKAVTFGKNVAVYGYVLTEGKGMVSCDESS